MESAPTIGKLAVQGDFREHAAMLCGLDEAVRSFRGAVRAQRGALLVGTL